MGAIWIAWVWHMSCYGWAMGMGRSWWLWYGYGYKFEGKCRALHLYIYDLTAIAHRERSEWRWSLCDLAARPPVECQWRTSQARGADRKGDRTLWGQEWQRWQVHAQLHKQFEAADARLPSFFFCFCILLPVRQSLAQAQGPVSRPQPSGEANRLSRRGRRGERRGEQRWPCLRCGASPRRSCNRPAGRCTLPALFSATHASPAT